MRLPNNSIINYGGVGSDPDGRLAPMSAWMASNSCLFEGKSVLDIASNAGHFPLVYVDAGASFVMAVEPRKVFEIQFNESIIKLSEFPNRISWIVSTVEDFTPPQCFDVVSCLGLVYHMKNGWGHLKRIVDGCGAKILILDTMLFDSHSYAIETGRINSNCVGLVEIVERPTKKLVEKKFEEFGWTGELVLENWQIGNPLRGMWLVRL